MKAKVTCVGPPSRDSLSTSQSRIKEVICSTGKCIAFLSFPHCLQNGISSRLVRMLQVPGQTLCNCPGEGKGLVLSQERILLESFPGGLPTRSLWKREKKGEVGERQSFYFLFIFYVPTTSFRLSEVNCRFAFYCLCLKPIPFYL